MSGLSGGELHEIANGRQLLNFRRFVNTRPSTAYARFCVMIEPSTSRSALDGRSPASSPAPSRGDCFNKLSCKAGEVGEAEPDASSYASEVGTVVKSREVGLVALLAAAGLVLDGSAVSASPAAAAAAAAACAGIAVVFAGATMTELRISSLVSPSSRPKSISCI
jgi:hypothetical protein